MAGAVAGAAGGIGGGLSVAIGVTTAALTAAIAAISVLSQLRAYGRALSDHSREIDQDLQVVKFWEEWLRVRQSCTPKTEHAAIEERVRRELDSLPLFPTREVLFSECTHRNE